MNILSSLKLVKEDIHWSLFLMFGNLDYTPNRMKSEREFRNHIHGSFYPPKHFFRATTEVRFMNLTFNSKFHSLYDR